MKQVKQSTHQAYYNAPAIITHYKEYATLDAGEATVLSRVKNEIASQPILDIGIGGGRTVPYLHAISKFYIGIDFSEGMIRSARERFPDINIFVGDARDLSMFSSSQFAAVFFLGAGIDDISATDRLLVLHEINRILRSRGLLILATHNCDAHYIKSGLAYGLRLTAKPHVLIKDNLLRVRSFASHCARQLLNLFTYREFVICMDYDECFADQPQPGVILPTYYICMDAQIRQLAAVGFYEALVVDQGGNAVADKTISKDLFLYYVVRKQPKG